MKRIVSCALVTLLALSMTTAAFALDPGKITGMAESLSLGYSGSGGDAYLGEVYPQDERVEYISLYDTMFTWEGGDIPAATPAKLTAAQIRAAKVDVKSGRTNSKVIESIAINAKESRVEIKFAKEYAGTGELDFDFDVFLTLDGRRQNDYGVNFSGTFRNPTVELYSGYDTVDISDGTVAEAMEYIPKLEVEIGNGVTVSTRMSKGKRVYGTTTRTPDNSDDEVFRDHPTIRDVIHLRTVGLNGSGNTVKLSAEYSGYYVYGKDLSYFGTGKDALEYSDTYYLSGKKLDIAGEEPAFVSEAPKPVESHYSSVTDKSPPNVNYNPGTGR